MGEIELSDMDCMLKVKPNIIVAVKGCIVVHILVAILAAILSFTSIKTVVNKCCGGCHIRHFDPTHYFGAFPTVGLNAQKIFLFSCYFRLKMEVQKLQIRTQNIMKVQRMIYLLLWKKMLIKYGQSQNLLPLRRRKAQQLRYL